VIITNVTDPGNPFVLEATESADPVSVIMDNLRDYQYAISDSFKLPRRRFPRSWIHLLPS